MIWITATLYIYRRTGLDPSSRGAQRRLDAHRRNHQSPAKAFSVPPRSTMATASVTTPTSSMTAAAASSLNIEGSQDQDCRDDQSGHMLVTDALHRASMTSIAAQRCLMIAKDRPGASNPLAYPSIAGRGCSSIFCTCNSAVLGLIRSRDRSSLSGLVSGNTQMRR